MVRAYIDGGFVRQRIPCCSWEAALLAPEAFNDAYMSTKEENPVFTFGYPLPPAHPGSLRPCKQLKCKAFTRVYNICSLQLYQAVQMGKIPIYPATEDMQPPFVYIEVCGPHGEKSCHAA